MRWSIFGDKTILTLRNIVKSSRKKLTFLASCTAMPLRLRVR